MNNGEMIACLINCTGKIRQSHSKEKKTEPLSYTIHKSELK